MKENKMLLASYVIAIIMIVFFLVITIFYEKETEKTILNQVKEEYTLTENYIYDIEKLKYKAEAKPPAKRYKIYVLTVIDDSGYRVFLIGKGKNYLKIEKLLEE